MMARTRTAGTANLPMLVALGTIWGLSNPLTKLALEEIETFAFAFWQVTLALAVLAAIALVRRSWPPLGGQHLRYYVFNGLIGLAIPGLNIAIVVQHIPAGLMSAIVSTAALFTYVLAVVLRQERFQWLRACGVLLGLAGALLILVPRTSLPEADMAGWVLMAMLTPLCYGINGVFAERFMPDSTGTATMALGLLATASLCYLPVMLASGQAGLPLPPVWPSTYALYALALGACGAYLLYFSLIRHAGSVFMSQVGYIVVAIGIVGGMLIFGERYSLWVWGGVALLMAGLTLVNAGQDARHPA